MMKIALNNKKKRERDRDIALLYHVLLILLN